MLEGAEGGSLHGPWGADIDRRGAERSGASADLLGRTGGVVSRGEVRGEGDGLKTSARIAGGGGDAASGGGAEEGAEEAGGEREEEGS